MTESEKRKAGRPATANPRQAGYRLRLTQDELNAMEQRAADLGYTSLASYLRSAGERFNKPPRRGE